MSASPVRRPRPGIRDVAEAAGVSVTTVSHALSGARAVHASTREKVLRAAADLGYVADPRASGLRRNRSFLVGLVGDRMVTSPHASRMVLGAQEAVAEHGSLLVALDAEDDPELEERQIGSLLAHRVDAVVYARMFHQFVEVPASLAALPVVLLDASSDDPAVPSAVPDEQAIAALMVGHLLAQGHRRIGMLTTVDQTPAAWGREQGYVRTLADAGIAYDDALLLQCATDTVAAREAALPWLARDGRPTAVFCFNDQLAMGVYQAAAAHGLSIPRDLSVTGVDDLELISAALVPGLTTAALPHREMAGWAVAEVMRMLTGEASAPGAPRQIALPATLVERGSVAPPAGQ
ncbi:LacI family DNA-binding transcriptional regulator [Nocardioides cavernaquae]|uniref:LacI family DNA-binding transcriptional regulator n=1 Tax=Nocardioides cavernaquae TaxID=2321396 RepID=A0A3A5H969_9ACTN|nr:LacI family DNA-binding transcriptional regulator [Nocardioides cavernaquae]RJS45925.1 LacI family DNA-binding transcriptional regulator [Nocardioides cavernaquae]